MPDGVLDSSLKRKLLDALSKVSTAQTFEGRTALLYGIPNNIQLGLNRSNNAATDLINVLNDVDQLGRLDNGERPLVIIANNAWRITQGSALGRLLEKLQAEIEQQYGLEPPLEELPDTPEVLIFGGEGEWVANSFMAEAQAAARRVARLSIPRFIGRNRVDGLGTGTGWLVTPRLILTSRHVVAARNRNEDPATAEDFDLQGKELIAWFDYHREGEHKGPIAKAVAVVDHDEQLDYALLRLEDGEGLADRSQMLLAENPTLQRGARLNIIQCPGGGPLRFAIRNNFYVGKGERPYQVRYLTDTNSGSSGSPVLDDSWKVVALHRGAKEITPKAYEAEAGQMKIVKFHNEGIAIQEILSNLPAETRKEIKAAQGWA
jgi:hypothetical protein